MYNTDYMFLAAMVLLVVAAVVSLRSYKGSVIACVIALSLTLVTRSVEHFIYAAFIVAIAILNSASLSVKENQIRGVDYSLVVLIALATVYIVYTEDPALILATFVITSVPTYVLVMIGEEANVNVGIKYITFMVLATILFIIGAILLIYIHHIPNNTLYILGLVMLILGLSMEVGCAPLHEWVPDVFTAADPLPISIIASITKIVPFFAAFKILSLTITPSMAYLSSLFIAAIAVISMFVGNIGALLAKEMNRVLAYSTVANMGYIISTLVVLTNLGYIYLAFTGALLQLFVNSMGKLSFFTSVEEGAYTPLMYLLALSFVGIPPLMGFWSKLFILLSLVGVGYSWLAILLIINSAISIPYYLRIAGELGVSFVPNRINGIAISACAITLITIFPPNWLAETVSALMVIT